MQPALLIRLRPAGPWRYGPGDGGDDRVDTLYRSDRLYSAVTQAMRQLGLLDEWLESTAQSDKPAVVFSSLFPYQGDTLFAPPPANLWPPAPSSVTAQSPVFLSKVRWNAARFVPLGVIEAIVSGQSILADQWMGDAESGCLLRRDRPTVSPFRTVSRSGAAVDRMSRSAVHTHSSACVEFETGAGLWCVARYADVAAEAAWNERVKACFRLLGDTGFGGKRSSGWGQSEAPQFAHGAWPNLLFPKLAGSAKNGGTRNGANGDEWLLYWLLSVYTPGRADVVDWSGGDYGLVVRGGRVESAPGANKKTSGVKKKTVRMIAEGSVLAMRSEPVGAAVDVAPEQFEHPVYRSGFAVGIEMPRVRVADIQPVELPTDQEALEARPCPEPVIERELASASEEQAPERVEEQPDESIREPEPGAPAEAVPVEPDTANEAPADEV